MTIFIGGCTGISPQRSSSTSVVIHEDPLLQSSMSYIDALANAHCAKYDSTAKFQTKESNIMSTNLYYYSCNKNTSSPQVKNSMQTNVIDTLSLEDAKKKCSDLGFKNGTEGFGKCVLKLSN
jgi:hypothetical protein